MRSYSWLFCLYLQTPMTSYSVGRYVSSPVTYRGCSLHSPPRLSTTRLDILSIIKGVRGHTYIACQIITTARPQVKWYALFPSNPSHFLLIGLVPSPDVKECIAEDLKLAPRIFACIAFEADLPVCLVTTSGTGLKTSSLITSTAHVVSFLYQIS